MQVPQDKARLVCAILLLLAAGFLGGCATTDTSDNSMPWNTPQNWEGAPALPIFTE